MSKATDAMHKEINAATEEFTKVLIARLEENNKATGEKLRVSDIIATHLAPSVWMAMQYVPALVESLCEMNRHLEEIEEGIDGIHTVAAEINRNM